jgi:hypothetical protein
MDDDFFSVTQRRKGAKFRCLFLSKILIHTSIQQRLLRKSYKPLPLMGYWIDGKEIERLSAKRQDGLQFLMYSKITVCIFFWRRQNFYS